MGEYIANIQINVKIKAGLLILKCDVPESSSSQILFVRESLR